jgi:hypothetical protein
MGRVFSAVLVRSGILWLVPMGIALELPTYLEGKHLLGGDWTTTIEVANGSAPLLMILAAVAGALFSGSWYRYSILVQSLPRRSWVFELSPAVLVALVLAALHLCFVVIVLLIHGSRAGQFHVLSLILVVPAFLAFSFIGAAAARCARSRLTAPLLGVVLYGAIVVTFGSRLEGLFAFGGAGVEMAGYRLNQSYVLSQLAWFSSIAVLLILGLVAARQPRVAVPGVAMMGGIALALVSAGASAVGVGVEGHQTFDQEVTQWACLGTQPDLCAIEGHESSMRASEPQILEALRRLAESPEFPVRDTYRERLGASDDGSGAGQISLSDLETAQGVVFRVVAGSYLCSDDWTYEQVKAAQRMATIVARGGLDEPLSMSTGTAAEVSRLATDLQC